MTDDEEDRRASQGVTPAGLGPWRTPPPPAGFEPFPPEAVDGSVSDRFLAVAERHGDRTALSAPAGSWTFTALRDEVLGRAGAIAAAVDDPRPQPVAILADHDGPLVATILAVIAAGHIVVVLDPIGPDDQLDHARRESGATLVVHDRRWAEAAAAMTDRAGTGLRTIGLDDLIATEDFTPPSRGHDDPLLLAFTSGTSGASKAAIVTHGVLLNLIRGATDALGIGPTDRMPMLFPTSLAVAAYPMFLPLLNGGTLATLDVRSVGLAPVADFLATERITLAYMAPTVVRFLTDALAGRSFPDLRMIALGGELVDAEVVRLTVDLFDPTHVANGFGTTETGVITLHVLDAAGPTVDGAVPAGHPVPDVELVILDDHGQVLPIGGSGEVAIVSPHVFAGYWGHPELNAQVLEPDPSGRPGWIRYRTGDLGRLDDHGVLTVLGRLDTNVKVRGRFVVLGDVEAALHELDEVADAAVVARERDGVTELCGAVTPSAASGPLEGPTLRAALLASQEAYRVPSRWEVLDELPRLPNGKVDRQALAALFDLDPEPVSLVEEAFDRHDEPARREVVEELRPLWELLLPVERVGVDDDFFHLGGDSLVAAQMLVMAEQRLGITVPMGELVHARTLAQLTDVILRIRRGGELTPALVSCVQAGDEASRPRLWFVHDLQGSAFRVRHVAAALGSDQPVWSFESPLLRGEPNPFTSLDTFAAGYVRHMRAAQPEGPYWLAGYSFGGICAYEMARQLQRDGEEAAFVGVIDVGPGYRGPGWGDRHPPLRPWFGVAKPPPTDASIRDKARHYAEMTKASPLGAARHLSVRSGLASRLDPYRFRSDLHTHGRVRPQWRLWYAWEEHWKLATQGWDRSNRYDGPIELFWADDTASSDASLGWGELVPEVRVHRFAGDHMGILEPRGAPSLAKALRPVIDEILHQGHPASPSTPEPEHP